MEQKRNFLLLEPHAVDNPFIAKVLKSPLELAEMLIYSLFEGQYAITSKALDDIKLYSAGLNRAVALEQDYALAGYAKTQFTFQQFFHNSFKARQGKVLEVMLQHILKSYGFCEDVPQKPKDQQELTKRIFNLALTNKRDIDVLGYNKYKKKSVAIQLRSRDNTGGTTAKGSLADWIKYFLHDRIEPQEPLLYVIGVWDVMDQQQKRSTIDKLWISLQDVITFEEKSFFENIETGIILTDKLSIRLCYGYPAILEAVYDWFEFQEPTMLTGINDTIARLMNWDDLWVAYAVASLEIGTLYTAKETNIQILNSKIDASVFQGVEGEDIHAVIEDLTLKTAIQWKENALPMSSMQENLIYLRDLLFLKAIYSRFTKPQIRTIRSRIK